MKVKMNKQYKTKLTQKQKTYKNVLKIKKLSNTYKINHRYKRKIITKIYYFKMSNCNFTVQR